MVNSGLPAWDRAPRRSVCQCRFLAACAETRCRARRRISLDRRIVGLAIVMRAHNARMSSAHCLLLAPTE